MQDADAEPLARALRLAGRFLLRVPWPLAALLVFGWGYLIWSLSSHAVPLPSGKSLPLEFLSNLAHAPLFGILTLFTAGLLLREPDGAWPRARWAPTALVAALVLAYGVLDEWHQSRTPGRDASAFDILTDLVSALAVLWVVHGLGSAGARGPGLPGRLVQGLLACAASAALATLA